MIGIKRIFHNLYVWLFYKVRPPSLIDQEPAPESATDQPTTIDITPATRANKRVEKKQQEDNFGTWYYLDNILDKLEDYFVYLKLFRKIDREAFDLYSRTGGQIISHNAWYSIGELSAKWRNGSPRPSFSMIHFTDEKNGQDKPKKPNDIINVKLMYFRKHKFVYGVQPTQHTLYEVCMFYAERENKDHALAGNFYVSVSPCGEIKLLRECKPVSHSRWPHHHIPGKRWKVSSFLEYAINDRKATGQEPITHQELARDLFRLLANTVENANAGLQVRASKRGLVAVFCIDMLRTPYFFKDRKKTITVGGNAKKIFHIVRTHSRDLANGKKSHVKSHFRGERKFKWHDYNVVITMPGLHHKPLESFVGEAIPMPNDAPVPGYITQKELGVKLHDYVMR